MKLLKILCTICFPIIHETSKKFLTSSLHLNAEILQVSGMIPNQGFGEFDGVRNRSPSPMSSPNIMSNFSGAGGFSGWSSLLQEVLGVLICLASELLSKIYFILFFFRLGCMHFFIYCGEALMITCSFSSNGYHSYQYQSLHIFCMLTSMVSFGWNIHRFSYRGDMKAVGSS